jgi:glycosyltransferase involved in cell wall biosynthesis/2-polyprenyl-3-methyl-5-hydroxy-6-metoxy-1,4-benzoquinol methylase
MKILSILTYYHPHWTGLTVHARIVAERLAARGHEVTVLAIRHSPDLAEEEIVAGVRVVRLPPLARVSRGMPSARFPSAASRRIRESDVVHAHTPLGEAGLVAALCRFHRRPLLLTHHGDLVMPSGAFDQLVERVVVSQMTAAARAAAEITSYSRDYAESSDFLRPFARKTVIVPPPVEIPVPRADDVACRRREAGLEGKRLVGFAGRFVEEKGFDVLLEALPAMLAEEPGVHLVYAGEARVAYERFFERCRPLLERHGAHVAQLGLLRDPDRLAAFYAMLDVFALPSRSDCLGLVQVEAMLCGTPVVATDIPGARDAVRRTGMGRLVPAEDPRGLAAGIVEVLRERDRFVRSRAEIRSIYDTEATIDLYEDRLRRLVEGERPRPVVELRRLAEESRPPQEDRRRIERLTAPELDLAYRRRARRLLEYLEIRDGDVVADWGCGMGVYLRWMSRLRRLRTVGFDVDADRLRQARAAATSAVLARADLARVPIASSRLDGILLSEVLEHVADDEAVLREAWRTLRPGGILAISVPHADYPALWDPWNRAWSWLGGEPLRQGPLVGIWTGHRRLYWPEELARKTREAGFAIEALEEATSRGFPFSHFLLYGVGKPLFERGLLPATLHRQADRLGEEEARGGGALGLVRRVLERFDRDGGDEPPRARRRFVNVLVKARKV